MSKNDGGPAFPCEAWVEGKDVVQIPGTTAFMPVTTSTKTVYAGMTLRDWFAGQALAGMLSNFEISDALGTNNVETEQVPEKLAQIAYEFSDAMIKAREGKE